MKDATAWTIFALISFFGIYLLLKAIRSTSDYQSLKKIHKAAEEAAKARRQGGDSNESVVFRPHLVEFLSDEEIRELAKPIDPPLSSILGNAKFADFSELELRAVIGEVQSSVKERRAFGQLALAFGALLAGAYATQAFDYVRQASAESPLLGLFHSAWIYVATGITVIAFGVGQSLTSDQLAESLPALKNELQSRKLGN